MADRPISFVEHLEPPDRPWEPFPERPPRFRPTDEKRAQIERERKIQRALEDERKRTWIEDGNDLRQPPQYRGRVYDHADQDGVHPTAFPPAREGAGGELTEEFIDFQNYNATTYAKNPEYYCVRCTIRYNAREGGMCGPCIGVVESTQAAQTPLFGDVPIQPRLPEYPL